MSTASCANLTIHPEVTPFFDADTNTISYVVKDPDSSACAVVDSVLDFDYAAGRIGYRSADVIIAFIRACALSLEWLIETHVHADHLSAAPYVQQALGGKVGIGNHITEVTTRDATLAMPRPLIPSVQVNTRGGQLPPAES